MASPSLAGNAIGIVSFAAGLFGVGEGFFRFGIEAQAGFAVEGLELHRISDFSMGSKK